MVTGRGSGAVRSDARRNRVLVLRAAQTAFEEQGLAVPLGEIARRAGVGAGTVYRHFPSKGALFRATVADRMRLFTDTARELADVEDAGEVFFRFLSSVVRVAARNKALCEALEAVGEGAGAGGFQPSTWIDSDFGAALGVLLTRAQEAGDVREDVGIGDVGALLVGCLAMERRGSGAGVTEGRTTALVCDGLRPGRNVTKLPMERMERNESRCGVCGEAIRAAGTGRRARYCGGACRQKAHRRRLKERAEGGAR